MKPKYVEDESHMTLLPQFKNWCKNSGIGHEDDEAAHWPCFLAGATAMYLLIQRGDVTLND